MSTFHYVPLRLAALSYVLRARMESSLTVPMVHICNECPRITHDCPSAPFSQVIPSSLPWGFYEKWVGPIQHSHSVSGYVFILGNGAISWYSGKQKCVSTSTAQAEYIALSHATKEAIFLRQLFSEFSDSDYGAICINEDNQATLAIARNPVFHSKVKHIDLSYHFTREAVANGNIQLKYCSTNGMYADVLTKPLTSKRFTGMLDKLGLSFIKA